MDYKEKYEKVLENAKAFLKRWECVEAANSSLVLEEVKDIFPELKEMDELTWLTKYIEEEVYYLSIDIRDEEDRIKLKNLKRSLAWLEKQESVGEIVERCKTSWYNEGKIQGQIEGLSDDEKYQQGWHDALEKQGEQNPTNKIEPKFKVGDKVYEVIDGIECTIESIDESKYHGGTTSFDIKDQDKWELI